MDRYSTWTFQKTSHLLQKKTCRTHTLTKGNRLFTVQSAIFQMVTIDTSIICRTLLYTHDVNFVRLVVEHLVNKFPADIYKFKSDNCATQYKCKWVFGFWSELSKRLGKIARFYDGVSRHGKGLVDSMSEFGVKGPLRRAIVTEGKYFRNSSEVRKFLSRKFEQSNFKQYENDFDSTSNREISIPGCRISHMISYHPNGDLKT